MLQYNGEKLGSIIDRSPKCTPEIAGDAIEFDWAMAKMWYRKLPMDKKRKKDKFRKSVEESLSEDVLSIERTRHFSRRARLNMVSYYKLEKDGNATTPMDVNKFKKVRKSHTNIIDECHGYISGILRRMIAQTKK